jgi:hypothetical protein
MTSLAEIIAHLGGQEIPRDALISLFRQAEEDALQLYTSTIVTDDSNNPLQPVHVNDLIPIPRKKYPMFTQPTPICNTDAPIAGKTANDLDLISPPSKPKASLKPSSFHPIPTQPTPPLRADGSGEEYDDDNDHRIYNKLVDGVGDGTHLVIASFIKTNDKIRDQLLVNFSYFTELLCSNIDGLKIHPIVTNKPLPILTSVKDANMPTTGTKIREYFFIQNHFSLIPGTRNKPKTPPQKVDSDGRFQFAEN